MVLPPVITRLQASVSSHYLAGESPPVTRNVVNRDILRGNQLIVAFSDDLDVFADSLELKHGDHILPHEMHANRATYERWHFLRAEINVLFDLHPVQIVFAALCLYRYDIVASLFVHAHIYLVRFDLSETGYRCAEVILQ